MSEPRFSYIAPIGEEEVEAVLAVMRRKQLSGFYRDFLGGQEVQGFEAEFAQAMGVKHAVSVNSGTSALHVALAAAGVSTGDEVIVPAVTFTATASAVLMVGAKPVFVDIDPETMCMDLGALEGAITDHTKAIIPVHLFGKVAPLDGIMALAKQHKLIVVEDACQAPGSTHRGQMVGGIGDFGCFSFVETKNMVIGEGGMIVTNSDAYAEKSRLIRNHGEVWDSNLSRSYVSEMLGYNFRLTEIPAAIGRVQLKKLAALNDMRKRNAAVLQEGLGGCKWWRTLRFQPNEVCHIFILVLNDARPRQAFVEALRERGIPVSVGYTRPLYKVPLFSERGRFGNCPASEELTSRSVWYRDVGFPHSEEDMRFLAAEVKAVAEKVSLK
jgi:perosamine synthetase